MKKLQLLKECEYIALEPKLWEREKGSFISSAGVKYGEEIMKNNMLPRGSALVTSSGDLTDQEITAIIHACPGFHKKQEDGSHWTTDELKPTLQGVILSVQNSIILAERHGYKSIVFPLIGGEIFLPYFSLEGTKEEQQLKLAEIIIKSALNQTSTLEKVVFIDFGSQIFADAWAKIRTQSGYSEKESLVNIVLGSRENQGIINHSLHNCEVIVNAANLDVKFGKGVSGMIATATGKKEEIDAGAKEKIREYWLNEQEVEVRVENYIVVPEKL